MLNRRVLGGFIVVAIVLAAGIPAAATDIPLKNWSAPATWTAQASSGGGRTALALTQGFAVPFIPVTPCRVMDTRGNGQIGNFGTPQLGVNVTRTVPIPTHPTCSGVPTNANAYSLNVAVTNTGSGAFGFLQVWPTGAVQPTTANLNYPGAGATLSNAVVVAAGTAGSINVFSGNASADVIIDINGYYAFDTSNALGGGFEVITSTQAAYAVFGLNLAANGVGTLGIANNGTGAIGVRGTSSGGIGVKGTSTSNVAVSGTSTSSTGVAGLTSTGVGMTATSTSGLGLLAQSSTNDGLWSLSTSLDGLFASGGRDGIFSAGGRYGVFGTSNGTTGLIYGVVGQGASTTPGAAGGFFFPSAGTPAGIAAAYHGTNGVVGVSRGAATGIGVLGVVEDSWAAVGGVSLSPVTPFGLQAAGWLGWSNSIGGLFQGNVFIQSSPGGAGNLSVGGTLSKGAGTFKIDHPLDPENKYLYHSFVESPDMMNIYNGIVELDALGEAIVQMPTYFEALNSDFRYQLTSIGRAQAGLYIADEVQDLKFRISGGKPHARVSWQVTGIRKDPFANANRVVPEVEKEPAAKGFYLHPAAYKQPPEKDLTNHVMATERAERNDR